MWTVYRVASRIELQERQSIVCVCTEDTRTHEHVDSTSKIFFVKLVKGNNPSNTVNAEQPNSTTGSNSRNQSRDIGVC